MLNAESPNPGYNDPVEPMKETLKRLQDLQRRLEALHEETAEVLSESHRLMSDVSREAELAEPHPVPRTPSRRPPRRERVRGKEKQSRPPGRTGSRTRD